MGVSFQNVGFGTTIGVIMDKNLSYISFNLEWINNILQPPLLPYFNYDRTLFSEILNKFFVIA